MKFAYQILCFLLLFGAIVVHSTEQEESVINGSQRDIVFEEEFLEMLSRDPDYSITLVNSQQKFLAESNETLCPDSSAILPCTCTADDLGEMTLSCAWVGSNEELASVFQQEFPSKTFKTFYISYNDNVTRLENIFNGCTFVIIYLSTVPNLIVIADDAFLDSVNTLRFVYVTDTSLTTETFPFTAVDQYTAIREIYIYNSLCRSFPRVTSESLNSLVLNSASITTLDVGIIDDLSNLTTVSVSGHNLTTLAAGTFQLRNTNFSVYVSDNQISTVEKGAFILPEPSDSFSLTISLANNNLTKLDEAVFGELFPFIQNLFVGGNPLICLSCDIAWLVFNRDYMNSIGYSAHCADGTNLMDLEPRVYELYC